MKCSKADTFELKQGKLVKDLRTKICFVTQETSKPHRGSIFWPALRHDALNYLTSIVVVLYFTII